jgi:ribulose-5-phosphate 4-epimerase/fuculose-1-phosphate aldolase
MQPTTDLTLARRGSSRTLGWHDQMDDFISIEGPVELIGGELTLRIPMSEGGQELAPFAHGIGQIEGDYLNVVIKPWLAEKLRITEGSLVLVDNQNGKFTITRSAKNDRAVH